MNIYAAPGRPLIPWRWRFTGRMVFSGGERLALPETGTVLDRTGEDTGTAPWK